MASFTIARMGHPILSTPARPVADPTTPDLQRLLADMLETLDDSGGIGLAAPQVGVPLRVVIYRVPAERNNGEAIPLRVLVNPVLEPLGTAMTEDWEACLSLPGLTGRVPRHARLRWRGQAADGSVTEGEAEGFHARILQHECDHLDGVLYPQRMTDLGTFGFAEEVRARLAIQADAERIDSSATNTNGHGE
ncbi:peptide deformylase [Roseospira visakhapatnamensis]|uniref:Peptide deformylase n=1 Tax=Roseospira visakhapatnamensis TaxID=390880 RepID=A0A7W6RH68_9PROT|nr:peptide deformylase [Roseospira visakhapatnamensis]MBB4267808.1 peptide deformylase [Roseospira visakhapatnamensis]